MLDTARPVSLEPGGHTLLPTSHPASAEGVNVGRLGDTYAIWASFPIGDVRTLFGADTMTLPAFTTLMAGPRWRAASDFFETRYGDVVLDEALHNGGQAAVVVGSDLDHAPTPAEADEALWAIAEPVIAGTADPAGAVPAALRDHIDENAYLPAHTGDIDADVDLQWLVLLAATNGETVSDDFAAALAEQLARTGKQVYRDLVERGYASRTGLADAAQDDLDGMGEAARALAAWAAAQPTTSSLITQVAAA